jgi:hypothetical protein
MIYLGNAFSLNMIPRTLLQAVRFQPVGDPDTWPDLWVLGAHSIVGHADTARLLGVECNRQSVLLRPPDELLVAQYIGPRLPEGSTELPEGARIEWVRVYFEETDRGN